jgi:hypothetical protein
MNKSIFSITLLIGGIIFLNGCGTTEEVSKDDTSINETQIQNRDVMTKLEQRIENPTISIITLDTTEANKKNETEELIGCDDKIVKVSLEGVLAPVEILNSLFEFDDYDGEAGYYNVFENSTNLLAKSVEVDNDGLARVELSGDLVTGGVCDTPRVTAQIDDTIRQIEGVKDVEIYINGENVSDFLSEKD